RAGRAHGHRVRAARAAGALAAEGLPSRRDPQPPARAGRRALHARRRHPGEPPAPQARAARLHQDAAQRGLRVRRRAAAISAPPDIERARLIAQRLPLRIRIEGPGVAWDSADEPRPPPPPGPPSRGPAAPHEIVTLANGDPLPLVLPPLPWPRPPGPSDPA